MDANEFIRRTKSYFSIARDMADPEATSALITNGVSFRGANLWVLIIAIFIASLGLDVNSTAVIIGAMLISPLMGPIMGMGFAIGTSDLELLRRAAKNFGVATLISVLTATLYFMITPLGEARSELLARTAPTIYDVLIATFGGAAGILALSTGGRGNVVPGVAIATALMPPLCTAGYGLASGQWTFFLGAFYLFFINTVFISLTAYVGVRLMGFPRRKFLEPTVARRARTIILTVAIVTMIPAAFMTVSIVKRSMVGRNVERFVQNEISQPGTQIISSRVDYARAQVNLVAVGREISDSLARAARHRLPQYGLAGYRLDIIQGERTDSLLRLSHALSQTARTSEEDRQRLVEISARAASLESQLSQYTRYEDLAVEIRGELKVLYPEVTTLSLARVAEMSRDTTAVRHFVAARVATGRRSLSVAERQKLQQWLKARTGADSLVVY